MVGASLACACVIGSPDFDDPTDGVGTTLGDSDSDAGTTGASTASAETSATGGDAGSGTDGGASTGGDTTSDASTSDASTSDASTSDASTTAADAEPLTLKNFGDPANCSVGPHCAYDMGQDFAPAGHKAVECFEAPIDPPFAVSRIGLHPRAVLGQANVAVKVYHYDAMADWPGALYDEQPIGTVSAGDGYKSLTFTTPVVVDEKTFCVGYESSGAETQLAPAVDTNAPVPGPSFAQMLADGGPCNTDAFRLTQLYAGTPRLCIDVDIAPP